jgi:hypothetical protein
MTSLLSGPSSLSDSRIVAFSAASDAVAACWLSTVTFSLSAFATMACLQDIISTSGLILSEEDVCKTHNEGFGRL